MNSTMARLALGGLLLVGGVAWAQQQPKAQSTAPEKKAPPAETKKGEIPPLDQMLAKALRNNPDIRVAEAKVREAEANLNQTRLQVAQKAVQLHHDLESARALVAATAESAAQLQQQSKMGTVPLSVASKAQADLIAAKAKLASLEAEVPYLMGTQPLKAHGVAFADLDNDVRLDLAVVDMGGGRFARVPEANLRSVVRNDLAPVPTGSVPEQIRKALDTPAGGEFQNMDLGNLLDTLGDKTGVAFVFRGDARSNGVNLRVNPKTPLGAVLQAIEDTTQVGFLVRDYGILVVPAESIPPGAVTLRDFWKQPTAGRSATAAGQVTAVDSKTSLVIINIGSDAGVKKGEQFEVYRVKPKPEYVGKLRIVGVRPHEAVGQAMDRWRTTPVAGDQVSRRIATRE
ncbi:MAG TPA: TolC family protein [Gemmataceae bacterium]|nr:TolC family protein [Gemmataceae bacterium]